MGKILTPCQIGGCQANAGGVNLLTRVNGGRPRATMQGAWWGHGVGGVGRQCGGGKGWAMRAVERLEMQCAGLRRTANGVVMLKKVLVNCGSTGGCGHVARILV
jgi:hypothetical protein